MASKDSLPPIPAPLVGLVDAHTHLNMCGAHDEHSVRAMVNRAETAGVSSLVTVADTVEGARFAVAASEWDDRVYAAVAVHPMHAHELIDEAKQELTTLAGHPRTVAVGETGLDWYWPKHSADCAGHEQQKEAFSWHIELAKVVNKPLMIHNREADEDILAILSADGPPEQVIFHCFSGDSVMAQRCADQGFYLSFAGPVTFKNAHALREAATIVPIELMLVETDAPFLTPHPYRGQPNEPYCVGYTARVLAELRGMDPEEFTARIADNARRVFSFPGSL